MCFAIIPCWSRCMQQTKYVLSVSWREWFSFKDSFVRTAKMKISRRHLANYAKNCSKKRAACTGGPSFLIQPIISLICHCRCRRRVHTSKPIPSRSIYYFAQNVRQENTDKKTPQNSRCVHSDCSVVF